MYLTRIEVLSKIDSGEFNYQEKLTKYGLDIKYDALAYEYDKLKKYK